MERWLPVVGFEQFYEVSDHGRIRSLPRRTRVRSGGTRLLGSRILKPYPTSKGHLGVHLCGDGTRRRAKVHHLVLVAFVGSRPAGLLGLHNDGDFSNNCLSNLRWDTYSANNLDAVRHGTHYTASKSHCPHGHPLDGVRYNQDGTVRQRYCKTCHRERGPRSTQCPNGHEHDVIRRYPDGTERPYCTRCQRESLSDVYEARRAKTHCPHGHLLDAVQVDPSGYRHRYCKTCRRESAARRREVKRKNKQQ